MFASDAVAVGVVEMFVSVNVRREVATGTAVNTTTTITVVNYIARAPNSSKFIMIHCSCCCERVSE